ncbi:MAG: tyrosine-type recombinase/integrase, partial [Ginsengibacter sp.]
METVILKPLLHRGQQCIGIYCVQNATLNYHIQKKGNAKWSRTCTCWYVPCTEKNYEQLAKALRDKAILETGELKKYLLEKKNNTGIKKIQLPVPVIPVKNKNPQPVTRPARLCKENYEAFQNFQQQLVLKSYSTSTIRTYTNEFMQFLQTIGSVTAKDFTTKRIKDYLQYCFEKLKLSENTLHSRMNALKFYYESVLKKEKFFWEIPRPKKPLQLPKVLGEQELEKLFNALINKKHKAILFTAYSAGLRVSEVAALKIKHVDSSRMQILVENAKGKKDRYVSLSPVLLDILREYIKMYKPQPKIYLFESEQTKEAYPT